jgi:hypothetical protein
VGRSGTVNIDTLKDPSGALVTFGKQLGISKETWAENEELGKLTYNEPYFDRIKAINLTLNQIVPLVDAYGDALVCRFTVGDYPVLEIAPGISDENLEELRNQTRHISTLAFELRLDKSKLVEKLTDGTPHNCRMFLYLFPEALERFLTCELKSLERSLWGTEITDKIMILVPKHEIWLTGPYLAVLGGEQIENWRKEVPPEPLNIERVKKMYQTCRENLKWQESWLKHLTPLHIKIEGRAPLKDPIDNALKVHLVNSIILYTAEKTTGNTDKPEFSTYTGTSQKVDVTLANPKEHLIEEREAGIRSFLNILDFAYQTGWPADRISFIQISMVQHLYAAGPDVRYRLLLHTAVNIYNGLNWNWRAFIEGKVDAYMAEVRALEDYIASTSQAFADQIEAMIKSLSDTMLAAVGVLLGSFIAALFQNSFNQTIFIIGMAVYAAYVFIFPLVYNMSYQWHRYKTIDKEFIVRHHRFEERLHPDKVKEIMGTNITESEHSFKSWFIATLLAYIIVIILAIYAAIEVPVIILHVTQ